MDFPIFYKEFLDRFCKECAMVIDRQDKYFRESGRTILKVDETEYWEDLGQLNKFRVTFDPVERHFIQK